MEESSQFCTIMLSKEKDPNQDITRRFAWETSERRPNWNPKSCQLQIDVFKLPWNGEGKKNSTCRKFRMVLPYSWHYSCHHGGIEPENVESRYDIQCMQIYLISAHEPRLSLKITVPTSASPWNSRLNQRNIAISFFIYRKPHAHRREVLFTSLDILAPTYDRSCVSLSSQMGLFNLRGTNESSLSASACRALAILHWLARPSGNRVCQLS